MFVNCSSLFAHVTVSLLRIGAACHRFLNSLPPSRSWPHQHPCRPRTPTGHRSAAPPRQSGVGPVCIACSSLLASPRASCCPRYSALNALPCSGRAPRPVLPSPTGMAPSSPMARAAMSPSSPAFVTVRGGRRRLCGHN
jgi:hypothetical protein